MEAARSENTVCFGSFKLDLKAGEVRQDAAKPIPLLWPNDTLVEFDHSISAAMNRLRQVLADSADNPRYIETLNRRTAKGVM